jgi:formamidopyrimidine-DNA glycosylase
MPELPEVEVICRGIRPFLVGRKVTAIHGSGKGLRHPVPMEAMQREMVNRTISSVTRRAKFLQISLQTGGMLIIHLGMTGNLGMFSPSATRRKHDHVLWSLDNGTELRYNDSRRFGSIRFLSSIEVVGRERTIFQTTGPEPFGSEFSAEYLQRLATGKNLAIKPFIMTSRIVAGIGNIYANESLFAAGIQPDRKVQTLTGKEWDRLVSEIRRVLRQAIECGGSTISDFVNAGQERGYFQINFKVYDREGEACSICSAKIEKQKIGGRASYSCPNCQK